MRSVSFWRKFVSLHKKTVGLLTSITPFPCLPRNPSTPQCQNPCALLAAGENSRHDIAAWMNSLLLFGCHSTATLFQAETSCSNSCSSASRPFAFSCPPNPPGPKPVKPKRRRSGMPGWGGGGRRSLACSFTGGCMRCRPELTTASRSRNIGEWIMHDARIPVAEYARYAAQFNPVKFDADAWAATARRRG